MSQALVDLNISHEKTVEIIRKIAKMYRIKIFFFSFVCIRWLTLMLKIIKMLKFTQQQ